LKAYKFDFEGTIVACGIYWMENENVGFENVKFLPNGG
jgi:hypothetical protein